MNRIKKVAAEAWKGWKEHDVLHRAAALSFAALFSMAPLLLLLITVATMVIGDSARGEMSSRLSALAGVPAAQELMRAMDAKHRHGAGTIALTLFIALLGGAGIVLQFESAMDAIWGAPRRKGHGLWGAIQKRAFGVFLLVIVLAGFLLLAAVDLAFSRMHIVSGGALHTVAILIGLFGVFALFAGIYRVVPQERPDWPHVLIASAITTALVAIGQFGFAVYLHYANFASAYGDAGSIVVLLVWLYYTCTAALSGAELAHAIAGKGGPKPSGRI
jgi:membrane protein